MRRQSRRTPFFATKLLVIPTGAAASVAGGGTCISRLHNHVGAPPLRRSWRKRCLCLCASVVNIAPQSHRNATIGSTLVARRAGK